MPSSLRPVRGRAGIIALNGPTYFLQPHTIMEELSYDPDRGQSVYDQLTGQSQNAARLALAMLHSTIVGTAHLRADAAFLCGKPKEYRPDWEHEYAVVKDRLSALGIEPEALTQDRREEYRNSWIARFKLVHDGGHDSLVVSQEITG